MFKNLKFIILTIFSLCLFSFIIFLKRDKIIYVYNDQGASQESVKHAMTFFKKNAPNYKIETINAEEIKHSNKLDKAALFVMPGGADIPYTKKLNGEGNQKIKAFVENGGAYLGLCAGSYYGAQYVEFDKGGKLEVLGERELSFFPGKAIGPILAPYEYKSHRGSRAAKIEVQRDKEKNYDVRVFYNGGGYFENAHTFKNVHVLAFYEIPNGEKLPAIIHIPQGRGNVILSGVHFEYQTEFLDNNDVFLKEILPSLDASQKESQKMTQHLMKILGIG